MRGAGIFLTGLGLSLLIFGLMLFSTRFPTPVPATAPASEYSAERAATVLGELLAENVPHPIGSPENRRVKERIAARLGALGLEVEEQSGVGCHSRFSRCGFVENIMARIPGRGDGPAVLLMSHYDSVPMAAGAGDDGSGLAAMLEVGRILAAEAPFRNPVILLFTDGEEFGLLGAEAFFGQHPWAQKVGVVLNVEGSGSAGESLLLRTGPDSGWVVDAYLRTAGHPSAYSVADEVFKRMPNDTDFSVVQRAGLAGIDFSFAGERNHYHSPLDTVENLSRVTLQHHGENLLPLTRELASMDIGNQASGDRLFLSLAQITTLTWSPGSNLPLAILALLLLLVSSVACVRNGSTTTVRIVIGFGITLAVAIAVILLNIGVFKMLGAINGVTVNWPAQYWPFRLCLAAASLTAMLAIAWLLGRFADFWSELLGAWFLYLLLALVAIFMAPLAANLFLAPVLACGVFIAAFALRPGLRPRQNALVMLTLAVASTFTFFIAWNLEQTQGYRLVIAIIPFFALYAVTLLPLVRSSAIRHGKSLLVSVMALAVGIFGAITVPLYSEWRPQHLNFLHIEDHDQGGAHWLIATTNPYPDAIAGIADFRYPETAIAPWTSTTSVPAAPAPSTGAPAPRVNVLEASAVEGGRRLLLHVASPRGARHIQLLVPASAGVMSANVDGHAMTVDANGQDWLRLSIVGVPEEGFELEVLLTGNEVSQWYVHDRTAGMPIEAKALIDARAPLAAPVHGGDLTIIFTRVTL